MSESSPLSNESLSLSGMRLNIGSESSLFEAERPSENSLIFRYVHFTLEGKLKKCIIESICVHIFSIIVK